MSPSITTQKKDGLLIIKIRGPFTFPIYKEFYASYKDLSSNPSALDIDMSGVDYIDSAALGMLLSMRNYFNSNVSIRLLNPNKTVKSILGLAHFEKKFQIT